MSLKLIPVERAEHSTPSPSARREPLHKRKHFNPGQKIKTNKNTPTKDHKESFLKHICMSLVHFINRGSRFTYEQIDELIMALQRGIMSLQKKKAEMVRRKQK